MKSTSEKIKLQLFPLDDVACRCLELEKNNPHLELMIGIQEKISSVLKHLNQKWGKPKMTSGELMLFPSDVQLDSLRSCKRWTINDSDVTAADVYSAIGSPAIFRLRYGWFSDLEIKASDPPLIGLEFKKHPWSNENEKGKLIDIEQIQNPPIPMANTKHVPATTDASVKQNACSELDDTCNKLNPQGEKMFSQIDLQASTHSEGSLIKKLDLNMVKSFGYLENDRPSYKELNNGVNTCFDGLIGNSQISDPSQYFSQF